MAQNPNVRCPAPGQLEALIVYLETTDEEDREPEDEALIEWLSSFLPDRDREAD